MARPMPRPPPVTIATRPARAGLAARIRLFIKRETFFQGYWRSSPISTGDAIMSSVLCLQVWRVCRLATYEVRDGALAA